MARSLNKLYVDIVSKEFVPLDISAVSAVLHSHRARQRGFVAFGREKALC